MKMLATVLAIVLVVVAITYGQVWLTGGNPQPLVWAVGISALVLLGVRRLTKPR